MKPNTFIEYTYAWICTYIVNRHRKYNIRNILNIDSTKTMTKTLTQVECINLKCSFLLLSLQPRQNDISEVCLKYGNENGLNESKWVNGYEFMKAVRNHRYQVDVVYQLTINGKTSMIGTFMPLNRMWKTFYSVRAFMYKKTIQSIWQLCEWKTWKIYVCVSLKLYG